MKKKILTTAILLTGLLSASIYNYTFKISDTNLFKESTKISYDTPEERTGVQSTGQILASDGGVDWYGEVSSVNLISGDDLASEIGLTAGISQFSDTGWLHVGLDGKELFIAKKPFRYNLSHNNVRSAISGSIQVEIEGNLYKIRSLSGKTGGREVGSIPFGGFDLSFLKDSEWNRIMYRLTENVYLNSNNTKASEEPFVNLAIYTEEDLHLNGNYGNGTKNHCADNLSINGYASKLYRGGAGVSYFERVQSSDQVRATYGWRPVLEKVE